MSALDRPGFRQLFVEQFLNAHQLERRRAALAPRDPAGDVPQESENGHERAETVGFLIGRVQEALDCLPEPARQAFVLFRYEGLSCAEIAGLLGAPVKTVETRIARATQLLAQRLGPYRHHANSL